MVRDEELEKARERLISHGTRQGEERSMIIETLKKE